MSSLKEIAEDLKVSTATVSWILSGQGQKRGFSEETIQKVLQKAKEVNYTPNMIAKSLAKGSSNTIGLIVPAIDDTFYAQLARIIEKLAIQHNYMLTYCSSDDTENAQDRLINMLKAKQVDGIIIAPNQNSEDGIKQLINAEFPFVLVDRFYPDLNTGYVIVDNLEASKKLTSYLIRKGSKKIAVLTSDHHLLAMQNRLSGYKSALEDANLSFDEKLIGYIDKSDLRNNVYRQLSEMLKQTPGIDGFFFTTHYLAMEAIRYFLEHNIDYNRRFELACFHQTEALDLLAPKMSFAIMPLQTIADKAINSLIEHIKNKKLPVEQIKLTSEIEYK